MYVCSRANTQEKKKKFRVAAIFFLGNVREFTRGDCVLPALCQTVGNLSKFTASRYIPSRRSSRDVASDVIFHDTP
ncbi:hypothetical protein PUN28_018762 [Cardiocondyla obscurior]|uniref:Uncharacterized protein n=1 Tax=Cardiocondyla obscurior TaxID=286306 RepID=A0AAW2EFU6_9HYME